MPLSRNHNRGGAPSRVPARPCGLGLFGPLELRLLITRTDRTSGGCGVDRPRGQPARPPYFSPCSLNSAEVVLGGGSRLPRWRSPGLGDDLGNQQACGPDAVPSAPARRLLFDAVGLGGSPRPGCALTLFTDRLGQGVLQLLAASQMWTPRRPSGDSRGRMHGKQPS